MVNYIFSDLVSRLCGDLEGIELLAPRRGEFLDHLRGFDECPARARRRCNHLDGEIDGKVGHQLAGFMIVLAQDGGGILVDLGLKIVDDALAQTFQGACRRV